MANDDNELKNNAPCEERQEARQLSEEELEQVTGGGAATLEVASEVAHAIFGAEQMDIVATHMPKQGDPVAARLADAPTNLEVIKRIDIVVGSAELVAVKLAIDEATR